MIRRISAKVPPSWRLLLLSLLLALLTTPFRSAVPGGLLDDSWGFAQHAWVSGSHGQVPPQYFTYGPLGFLAVPVMWGRLTYACAVLFVIGVQTALCRVVLARLLRLLPLGGAAVLTFVLASLMGANPPENLVVVVALLAVEVLERGALPRPRLALTAACVGAGLNLLIKFSTGLVSVVLLAVVVLALAGPGLWRRVAAGAVAVAGSLLVGAVGFALVTGEVGGFPTWLRGSQEISSGYTGMGLEVARDGASLDYWLAAPIVLALVLLALLLAWLRRDLVGLAAATVLGLSLYLAIREAFTRHDAGHAGVLASALVLLPLGLLLRRQSRLLLVPLLLAPIAYGAWQTRTAELGDRLAVGTTVGRVVDRLQLIADPAPARDEGRAVVRARFPMPPVVLAALQGHRVSVDNYDTAIVWAYDLRWGPDAVWAGYSSYTPWLDAKKAASLRAPSAPDRIVRYGRTRAIDARYAGWESPKYQLALQCGWTPVVTTGAWQVLGPGPSSCGAARPLGSTSFAAHRAITVPAARTPGSIVTLRLHLDVPPSVTLQALLLKPLKQQYVLLGKTRYRLVVATAGGPLIVRLPGGHAGSPGRYAPLDIDTITLPFAGTAEFFELPRP